MRFARQKPGKPGVSLAVGLSAAALALGLASCGGDEDSTSGTSSSTSTNPPAASSSPATSGSGSGSDADSGSGAKPASNGDSRQKTSAGPLKGVDMNTTPQEEREEASRFVPKHHTDTGGGSAQFRVREGADNSIQDFGDEITGSEFEEASTVLHNYLDAQAAGNWAAACATYSERMMKLIEQLGKATTNEDSGCAGILGGLSRYPEVDALREAEASHADAISLRAEDDRGFLIFRGFEDDVYFIQMDKDDGKWKVGAMEALSTF
jgi:hypothetical protein